MTDTSPRLGTVPAVDPDEIAAARQRHGLGISDGIAGDIAHLLNPIIGQVRRFASAKPGHEPNWHWIVDRLRVAVLLAAETGAEVERLRPAPCDIRSEVPYDFSWCETHDVTFRPGTTCKFDGRDPVEVMREEAHEQRVRAVRAEHQLYLAQVAHTDAQVGLPPVDPGSGRRGSWIQTFTGRAFWPLDPRADEIDPADISHALAHLCRYNGHVRRHLSVAEHCVLMSHAVSPGNALWALLHDATEAYMGDMIRPLKRHMPSFAAAEDRLMAVICVRFGLDPVMPAEVHEADSRILVDERNALMAPPPLPWPGDERVERLGVEIHGWSPSEAEARYLARLRELTSEAGS